MSRHSTTGALTVTMTPGYCSRDPPQGTLGVGPTRALWKCHMVSKSEAALNNTECFLNAQEL